MIFTFKENLAFSNFLHLVTLFVRAFSFVAYKPHPWATHPLDAKELPEKQSEINFSRYYANV